MRWICILRASWPIIGLLSLSVLPTLLCGCRGTTQRSGYEIQSAALLGVRLQSGWENSEAPLAHLDVSARPLSWPVGVKASTDLSGFFGSDTGEQTVGFGLGLTRSFVLVSPALEGSVGIGHLFLNTENDDLFESESDSWQANYIEAGLYYLVEPASGISVGLEVRYSTGDGPDLGVTQLDGDFLDLYLVMKIGPPHPPSASEVGAHDEP